MDGVEKYLLAPLSTTKYIEVNTSNALLSVIAFTTALYYRFQQKPKPVFTDIEVTDLTMREISANGNKARRAHLQDDVVEGVSGGDLNPPSIGGSSSNYDAADPPQPTPTF